MLETAVSLYLGLLGGPRIGLDADFDQTSGKRQDLHVTRMTLKTLGT